MMLIAFEKKGEINVKKVGTVFNLEIGCIKHHFSDDLVLLIKVFIQNVYGN